MRGGFLVYIWWVKKALLGGWFFILGMQFGQGQVAWQKTYGTSQHEWGNSIIKTDDGGYAIAGISNASGNQDVYLLKLDSVGNVMWSRTYGDTLNDIGKGVVQTPDGGYAIEGFYGGYVYLIRTNDAGDTLWTKLLGNTNYNLGTGFQQTLSGGFMIASSYQRINFGIYLVKTDNMGDTLKTNFYYDQYFLTCSKIEPCADGNFIVSGTKLNPTACNCYDLFVMKIDTNCNWIWRYTYGGYFDHSSVHAVETSDGGAIVTGNFQTSNQNYDAGLLKLSSNGTVLWYKTYGNIWNEWGEVVKQTRDGGYIMAAITHSTVYWPDALVIKTDAIGDTLWTKTYGGFGADVINDILETDDGGYLFLGVTSSLGNGGYDIYLIKTDSLGNSYCNEIDLTVNLSGTSITRYGPILQRTYPNPLLSTGPATVGTGGSLVPLCFLNTSEIEQHNTIYLFPNPTTSTFTITLPNQSSLNSQLKIYDVAGRLAYTTTLHTKHQTLNPGLSAGIYFVRVSDGEKVFTEKLVVQ
jgi:hypothetical protein